MSENERYRQPGKPALGMSMREMFWLIMAAGLLTSLIAVLT